MTPIMPPQRTRGNSASWADMVDDDDNEEPDDGKQEEQEEEEERSQSGLPESPEVSEAPSPVPAHGSTKSFTELVEAGCLGCR